MGGGSKCYLNVVLSANGIREEVASSSASRVVVLLSSYTRGEVVSSSANRVVVLLSSDTRVEVVSTSASRCWYYYQVILGKR